MHLPVDIEILVKEYAAPFGIRLNWREDPTPSCLAIYHSTEFRDYRTDIVRSSIDGGDYFQPKNVLMGVAAAAMFREGELDSTFSEYYYDYESSIDENSVKPNTSWTTWCKKNALLIEPPFDDTVYGNDGPREDENGNNIPLLWSDIGFYGDQVELSVYFNADLTYYERAGYWFKNLSPSRSNKTLIGSLRKERWYHYDRKKTKMYFPEEFQRFLWRENKVPVFAKWYRLRAQVEE